MVRRSRETSLLLAHRVYAGYWGLGRSCDRIGIGLYLGLFMVPKEGFMRYSDSVKPISYLKVHTSEIIRNVAEGHASYVITQHGEAKAVVQGVEEYENTQETLALLKILALGEQELAAGKTYSADDVFAGADKLIK